MFLWNFCHLFPVLFYDWNTIINYSFSDARGFIFKWRVRPIGGTSFDVGEEVQKNRRMRRGVVPPMKFLTKTLKVPGCVRTSLTTYYETLYYTVIYLLQTRKNNLKVHKMAVNKKVIDCEYFILAKNTPGWILTFCIAGLAKYKKLLHQGAWWLIFLDIFRNISALLDKLIFFVYFSQLVLLFTKVSFCQYFKRDSFFLY